MTAMRHWAASASLLFVPADQPRRVAKAAGSEAHAVILDLEDAVAPASKNAAREALRESVAAVHAAGKPVLVRINHDLLQIGDDLRCVAAAGADAIMLPKADGASLLTDLHLALHALNAPAIEFLALVEQVEPFSDPRRLLDIANAPRVKALALGSEDYCATLGAPPCEASLLGPCQALIVAARSAGVAAFAMPSSIAEYRALDLWEAGARKGRAMGADGGLCIHPDQCRVLNAVHRPTDADVAWAHEVIEASAAASAEGHGVTIVAGKMVDAPVLARARQLAARAASA